MDTIKTHLKNKQFSSLYFFLGEEVFLSDYYAKKLKEEIVPNGDDFNYLVLDPEHIESFQSAVEDAPLMAEKKFVVLKGRNFSEELKSDFVSFLTELLEDVPEYTTVLFICSSIDKKSKIYKLLSTKCTLCTFEHQKIDDLVSWINKVVSSNGKIIDRETAYTLISYAGNDMTALISEINKLVSYSGAENKITSNMIDAVVTKNIDSIVFKMIDCALLGKNDEAFIIFNDLKVKKEQPVAINGAINKYMTDLLRFKAMKQDGVALPTIFSTLKLKSSFQQKKYAGLEAKLSEKYLTDMINECANLDNEIKSGGIDGYTGVGILVAKMVAKQWGI